MNMAAPGAGNLTGLIRESTAEMGQGARAMLVIYWTDAAGSHSTFVEPPRADMIWANLQLMETATERARFLAGIIINERN